MFLSCKAWCHIKYSLFNLILLTLKWSQKNTVYLIKLSVLSSLGMSSFDFDFMAVKNDL